MGPGLDQLGAAPLRRCATGALACISYAVEILRATAFWGSILLPFLILAGLATDATTSSPGRLALLLALNVLCILLGRSYRPGE